MENTSEPTTVTPAIPIDATPVETTNGLHPAHRQQVADNIKASVSANTITAYRSDITDFQIWCDHYGYTSLPAAPETIAAYISELANPPDDRDPKKASTLDRRLAALGRHHKTNGHENPCAHETVRTARQGIRNTIGVKQSRKTELGIADLRAIVQLMDPDKPGDIRDKSLLLLGFTTAMRRSELAALQHTDLENHPKGLIVYKRRSKTDQQSQGKHIEVAYGKHSDTCAVIATRQWLDHANITTGPIFRPVNKGGTIDHTRPLAPQAIARIVKKHVTRIGHDPKAFAGHSMRRGFATEAARIEVPDRIIAQTTGHASTKSLDPYIADSKKMVDPPNGYLDL